MAQPRKTSGKLEFYNNQRSIYSGIHAKQRKAREHIEDHYEKLKNIADGNKPRVCDDWRFKGRQFVQFVSLGYFDFL